MPRYAHIAAVALAMTSLFPTTRAVATDTDTQLRQGAARLQQVEQELYAAWCSLLKRLPKQVDGKPADAKVVRFTLTGAVQGKTLHVELVRHADRWAAGRAWAQDYNSQTHRVDAGNLTWTGNTTKGELAGTIDVTLLLEKQSIGLIDDVDANKGKTQLACRYALQLKMTDGRIVGTYASKHVGNPPPIPASRGEASATVIAADAATPWQHRAKVDFKRFDQFGVHHAATRIEERAVRLYTMIRAIELSRTASISYAEGLDLAPLYLPQREAYDPPKVKQKKDAGPPSLDGLGGPPSLDDIGGPPQPNRGNKRAGKADANDPGAKKAVASLNAMLARTTRMREHIERYVKLGSAELSIHRDAVACEDPDFGPWFGNARLTHDESKPNVIPADAGQVTTFDKQQWASIAHWQLAGPFPTPTWQHETPLLPPMIEDGSAKFAADRQQLTQSYNGPNVIDWQALQGQGPQAAINAPQWSGSNRYWLQGLDNRDKRIGGLEHATFYATAQVHSGKEVELWAAIGIHQRGKLYINGQLAWTGPSDPFEPAKEEILLTKLRFRQGMNHLLFRVDNDRKAPGFWVSLCLKGQPRDAAQVKAHESKRAAARQKIERPTVAGWHGDRRGHYPDASPPLAWHIRYGYNIKWKTALAWWGNGTPIAIGDKLIVTMDPDQLICLDKMTGKVIWQRTANAYQLLGSKLAAEGKQLAEAAFKARLERMDVMPDHNVDRVWTYWEPDRAARFRQMKNDKDNEEYKERAEKASALKRIEAKYFDFMKKHTRVSTLDGYWYDHHGFAMATPVTDGKHIWWKNGMGVLACFDLDGNRQWMIRTEAGTGGAANIPSPVLVDDKVVLQLPIPRGKKFERGKDRLVAFHKNTGQKAWETKPLAKTGWGAGTPFVYPLTNGDETMNVLVTAGGSLVRAEDGHVLVDDMVVRSGDASPVMDYQDRAFFNLSDANAAVKLIMIDRDHVGCRRLWASNPKATYGGNFERDGMLYVTSSTHNKSEPGDHWRHVSLQDTQTGRVVRTVKRINRKMGVDWMPHVSAGNYVFITEAHSMFTHGNPRPPSAITVLSRGADPLVLAWNPTDRILSPPTFDGNRIYIRGYKWVFCVAHHDDTGRQYEARHVAETLLDRTFPTRPDDMQPINITPPAGYQPGERATAFKPEDGLAPLMWQFAGPFPLKAADSLTPQLVKSPPHAGDAIKHSDITHEFVTLTRDEVKSKVGDPFVHGQVFDLFEKTRRLIDVLAPIDNQAKTVNYYLTAVEIDKPTILRIELPDNGMRYWLSGKPLQHGQRLALQPGRHPLLAEVKINVLPKEGLFLSPRFWDSHDPDAELKQWRAYAARIKPWLQRVMELAPDSGEARRARTIISQMD